MVSIASLFSTSMNNNNNASIGSDGERSDSDSPVLGNFRKMFRRKNDENLSFRAGQQLKFSIDSILSPNFGRKTTTTTPMTPSLTSRKRVTSEEKITTLAKKSRPLNLSLNNNNNNNSQMTIDDRDDVETAVTPPATEAGVNAEATPTSKNGVPLVWPAWVYCTRYSDRPSSGPRCRRLKKKSKPDEKRPRTAFTGEQLARLKKEFQENRYLTEKRRQQLSNELDLNESQIKIWFQNKRAKIKKQSGTKNALTYHLISQGLYNHATVSIVSGDSSNPDSPSSPAPSSPCPNSENLPDD